MKFVGYGNKDFYRRHVCNCWIINNVWCIMYLYIQDLYLYHILPVSCLSVSLALQPSAGYDILVPRGFLITHNDPSQSVGLFWTSDQLVAETSTWQHTTYTTYKHPCSRWDFFSTFIQQYWQARIRTHDRSRRAALDLRLRPRGHWDRHMYHVMVYYL
jgi:hypothetical protein